MRVGEGGVCCLKSGETLDEEHINKEHRDCCVCDGRKDGCLSKVG